MNMMTMTIADIADEYAPYDTMPEFEYGFQDYGCGSPPLESLGGVAQQAYDRGMECAMRVRRYNEWIANNVGLD